MATDNLPRPYMVHITYEGDTTLVIGCYTIEQVNDLVNGAHARDTGFYGFTEPGEQFPRVSFNREGILFIQVFGDASERSAADQGREGRIRREYGRTRIPRASDSDGQTSGE